MSMPNTPTSLLFVCIGNTCRSPMAEAIAKQMWPEANIQSCGTSVSESSVAGDAAYIVKCRYGLDISGHKPRPLVEIDARAFDYVVILDKGVRNDLLKHHGVDVSRIVELHIDDPHGGNLPEHQTCAIKIGHALRTLPFK